MCVRPLTVGSLRGVPVLPPTTGQTTTLEKSACCLFSYLKVQITANSGLPVALLLRSDSVELGCVGKINPVAFQQPFIWSRLCLKCLKSGFAWNETNVPYFTFLSLSCYSCYHSEGRTHTLDVEQNRGGLRGGVVMP